VANAGPQYEDTPYVEPDHADAVLEAIFGPDPTPPDNPWSGSFTPTGDAGEPPPLTGDADRGWVSTDYSNPWAAEGWEPPRVQSEPDAPRYEDWSDPWYRGAAAGRDPQLTDLLDAGPAVAIPALYPQIAGQLGEISDPTNQWRRTDVRRGIDTALSGLPPSMFAGSQPLQSFSLRDPLEAGQGGTYSIPENRVWSTGRAGTIEHEMAHNADLSRQSPPSASPEWQGMVDRSGVLDDPRRVYQLYRSSGDEWAGSPVGSYPPYMGDEVLAEETSRLLGGNPGPSNPEMDRYLKDRLLGTGDWTNDNPYAPGSIAWQRYEQYKQNESKPVTFYRSRGGW
jgi:hypothetical protein